MTHGRWTRPLLGGRSGTRRHRILPVLGAVALLATEVLLSTATAALPAAAASTAQASYRYVFGEVWQDARTLTVPGQVANGRCTYVGAPTTVPPGFVHEVREVAFEPATCTYTVEDRTVPVDVAQPGLATAGPTQASSASANPSAPAACYQSNVCEKRWADGNPNGTDQCVPTWLYGNPSCSGTATWFDFCPLTLIGECYVTGTGEEKQSVVSVWTGGGLGVSNGCTTWNPSYPSQFVWIGHSFGDTLSSYNFNYGGSCASMTSAENGFADTLGWPDTCFGGTIWIDNSFTGDNNLNVTGSYGASMSGPPSCFATTYFVHYDYAYGTVSD